MTKLKPIPAFGVPAIVTPDTHMRVHLYTHPVEGINFNRNGQPTTVAQLERAIEECGGMYLLTDVSLPALDPGDVVVLEEGIFWIDRDWNVLPLQEEQNG